MVLALPPTPRGIMLTTPIVEGAYYEREDGSVVGPARVYHGSLWQLSGYCYTSSGETTALPRSAGVNLTRRVYLVPADPAEVVAELREMQRNANKNLCGPGGSQVDAGEEDGLRQAADIVAEKLGVGNG
jgi:hypothetical protein